MDSVIYIPKNYTDAGKLLGIFEIRNVAECAVICLPIILLTFLLCPGELTTKVIICTIILVPAGGFSLTGIYDYSLITFLRLYHTWKKNRRILIYRGSQWINVSAKKSCQKKKRA